VSNSQPNFETSEPPTNSKVAQETAGNVDIRGRREYAESPNSFDEYDVDAETGFLGNPWDNDDDEDNGGIDYEDWLEEEEDVISDYDSDRRLSKPDNLEWPSISEFKDMLRGESEMRLDVAGPWILDGVRAENRIRLGLYKWWLGAVKDGVGASPVEAQWESENRKDDWDAMDNDLKERQALRDLEARRGAEREARLEAKEIMRIKKRRAEARKEIDAEEEATRARVAARKRGSSSNRMKSNSDGRGKSKSNQRASESVVFGGDDRDVQEGGEEFRGGRVRRGSPNDLAEQRRRIQSKETAELERKKYQKERRRVQIQRQLDSENRRGS